MPCRSRLATSSAVRPGSSPGEMTTCRKPSLPLPLGDRGGEESVIILQPFLAVRGGGFQRGEARREMLGDGLAQRLDGAVVALPVEPALAAAVALERHARGPVQARPAIPVTGIIQVEHVAVVIQPMVAVERRRVALARAGSAISRSRRAAAPG